MEIKSYTKTNWNKIFIDLTNKANNGDKNAINELHNHYMNEKDGLLVYDDELIEFYKKGAKENKPYSLFHLGIMYCTGNGVEEDINKMVELFDASIKLGCSQAYVYMSIVLTKYDIKYDKDPMELLETSIKMNNSNGYVHKAIYVLEINPKESIKLFKKAIKLGNTYATYKLGVTYHDNKQYKKAIKFYKLAMDKNIHHAYFNLATMYLYGEYVKKDESKALELFTTAHNLGNDCAIISIGKIHQDSGDIDKAKECYQMSIDSDGDGIAHYNMAMIYKDENDHKNAIKHFIESAKTGHPVSSRILVYDYNVMNNNMTDEAIDDLLEWHNKMKYFGAYDGFMR